MSLGDAGNSGSGVSRGGGSSDRSVGMEDNPSIVTKETPNTVASVMNVTFKTSTPLWSWWGDNKTINGTASLPPEGAVAYQTEDVCGKNVTHHANTARFSAKGNPEVWWVWCAWWNTETRGWHTEGCTIVALSVKDNSGKGGIADSSKSGGSDAVVQCQCLMNRKLATQTNTFKGSFGVIKENREEDQEKRLEDKKGDVGSLLGYVFKRIASSFNVSTFEIRPSAMYLCFIPLALYLIRLLTLRARVLCSCCPGHRAWHERHDQDIARQREHDLREHDRKSASRTSSAVRLSLQMVVRTESKNGAKKSRMKKKKSSVIQAFEMLANTKSSPQRTTVNVKEENRGVELIHVHVRDQDQANTAGGDTCMRVNTRNTRGSVDFNIPHRDGAITSCKVCLAVGGCDHMDPKVPTVASNVENHAGEEEEDKAWRSLSIGGQNTCNPLQRNKAMGGENTPRQGEQAHARATTTTRRSLKRRVRSSGEQEYSSEYWAQHHDGMKTPFLVEYVVRCTGLDF